MTQTTAAARPKERNFAQTGYFSVPIELWGARLPSEALGLYAWICCEADMGHNPPADMMEPALALGMTPEQTSAALDVLKARKMVVVKSATDWELTQPTTWTKD